jgi:hypothetical protein
MNMNSFLEKTKKVSPKGETLNIILQVVGGVVLAAVIYWLSLFALNRDKLVITSRTEAKKPGPFPIVKGYIDCVSGMNMRFNTYNSDTKNYALMPRSVNRRGGAQFSYSFWMYLDDVSDENIKNKVIFCRGDTTLYDYKIVNKEDSVIKESGKDRIIKCPLVRFGNNYKELIAEFNTTDRFDEQMVIMNNVSETDSAVRRNALSLTPHYWVMFTFVFEDNVPINDFENGIAIKFYINDTLYQLHRVKSTLKQNNGDFVVLPDSSGTGIKSARLADLVYHNYAISDIDVKRLYNNGPSKSRYSYNNASFGMPLYLAASNRVDQTNL